ncbi:MAG: M3 family metallopeptidase [Pseudomonadales bacterium]
MSNPFFERWDTPYGIPPFDRIRTEHFEEAFNRAFAEHVREVEQIVRNDEAPGFENTVEAFEGSAELLRKVSNTFSNLVSVNVSDALQKAQMEIMPRYASHHSDMLLAPELFARVREVYESEDRSRLSDEQIQLLEEMYKAFIRAGAALDKQARTQIKALDEELASLKARFGQNLLKDTNNFELILESEDEVAGLPDSVLKGAAAEASGRGQEGKYVFTVARSSITPFLQFADRRDLREKLFHAYVNCANNDNEYDNKQVLARIAALRAKRARLLGYESHATYMLDDRMARTPQAVTDLLDQIWEPATNKLRREAADLQARIQDEGGNFELEPWDWWYYTEKVRRERFDLESEAVKPYFKLEDVRDGAFEVARKLYGVTFKPVHDVPVYHPDVQTFEVHDHDGALTGLFMVDYFMRPSKRGGAWMSAFRSQSTLEDTRPIIVNCCNFSKSEPCLLGLDEVRTLFHEFGHALHGLLSNVMYRSLSGTSVKKDFVELPSQIMEHWAFQPEVMKCYARHHETGEIIPDELIEKILATETFNQGFETTEFLAAAYLDMAWHTLETSTLQDVDQLEKTAMAEIGLLDKVHPRYHSTSFQHIFSGDSYSAGYYSYIWAEVLDADGFEAFKERSIFDLETANAFRKNILERGGSAEPMDLYRQFRGREPVVDPLLKNRGLTDR